MCDPICPKGMRDMGLYCLKNSYPRGKGKTPDAYGRIGESSEADGMIQRGVGSLGSYGECKRG